MNAFIMGNAPVRHKRSTQICAHAAPLIGQILISIGYLRWAQNDKELAIGLVA
jgi:hypothetical protein